MPSSRQKTCIARILSDLIKADNIIENSEVENFNQIVKEFDIKQEELIKAQSTTLKEAIEGVKSMSSGDKNLLRQVLLKTANSDDACVAREALILLTLSVMLEDEDDKYGMAEYDTMGSYTNDKYIIYLESDFDEDINDEIEENYEHICNLLKLWKFDFIYIPRFAQRFSELDRDYVHSIIRYMNPQFDQSKVDTLYRKMTTMDTKSFCRDVLINQRGQKIFHDIEPSLLINIGTSVVPYCSNGTGCSTFTEFLTIRLDAVENSVSKEIRAFLERYQDLLTEPEYYRPDRRRNFFKYFGFYKTVFDFLSRAEKEGVNNTIEIDVLARTVRMRDVELNLTPIQLATYVLILHQSLMDHQDGLPKLGRNMKLSEEKSRRLNLRYREIFRSLTDRDLYDDSKRSAQEAVADNFKNFNTYISHIRAELKRKLPAADLNYFMPNDTADNTHYKITIDPDKVTVIKGSARTPFCDYDWRI